MPPGSSDDLPLRERAAVIDEHRAQNGIPRRASPSAGGCACGVMQFVAEGQPSRVGLCHCFDCRKHHGAPFGAFAIFLVDKVNLVGDAPSEFAASARGRRCFCSNCGSPLFNRDVGSDEIELFIGAFDLTSQFTPTYEACVARREEWLPEITTIRYQCQHGRAMQSPPVIRAPVASMAYY